MRLTRHDQLFTLQKEEGDHLQRLEWPLSSRTLVTITMYMNFSVCPYVRHKLMCKAKQSGFYEENAKISIMAKTFTNTLVILY